MYVGLAKRVKARILLSSTSEIYGDPEVHNYVYTYVYINYFVCIHGSRMHSLVRVFYPGIGLIVYVYSLTIVLVSGPLCTVHLKMSC